MWRMCLPTFEKNEPRGKPKGGYDVYIRRCETKIIFDALAVRPSSVEYASIEMMGEFSMNYITSII